MGKHTFCCKGLFGGPNMGDELICWCVVNRLRQKYPDCKVYLLTNRTDVSRQYTQLDVEYVDCCWSKLQYYLNLIRHINAIASSNLLIIGGGGLIADYYSWAGIPSYCIEASWAILMGRRYVFVGLGVGKIRRRWLRPLARFACRNAAALYCRDEKSVSRMKELTERQDVRLGPDLGNIAGRKTDKEYVEKNYVLVNVRECPYINEKKLTEFCRELIRGTGELVLLSAEKPDTRYYQCLIARMSTEEQASIRIVEPSSLDEAIKWILEAKFVAAERLHVNLIAGHAGKRLLTINYEDKVKQFIDMLQAKAIICSLEEIGSESAKTLLGLDKPQLPEKLGELDVWAKRVFDETISVGLSPGSYRFSVRFIAGAYIVILSVIWIFYYMAFRVKRAIFGPGPILGRWYKQ